MCGRYTLSYSFTVPIITSMIVKAGHIGYTNGMADQSNNL